MTRPAVVVDGVAKRFGIPREQVHTLKERRCTRSAGRATTT